jgi:hypothetical protein
VNNYFTCLNQTHTAAGERACMDKFYRSAHLSSPMLGSGTRHAQGSADGPRGRLADGAPHPSLAHLSR